MKMNEDEMWDEIVSAGERVAYSYQQMVCAADALAEVLGYKDDYVLRRVLPTHVSERRDCDRILEWLNRDREELEAHVRAWEEARKTASRRKALLSRLKLSREDQRLLGIAR